MKPIPPSAARVSSRPRAAPQPGEARAAAPARLPTISDIFRSGHLIGHGAQLAAERLAAHVQANQPPNPQLVTRQMRRQLLRAEVKAEVRKAKRAAERLALHLQRQKKEAAL